MRGIRVLALAVALGIFHSGATAQTEPLRLGFLTVKTGPLAAGGAQMEQGIVLFLKERNYTLAGRKVELFVGDTGGNPAQAKTRTQELIERNRVHVIIGPLATFEALAIDDYIRQAQVPLVTPTSAAQKDLAQQKLNDYVIHAVGTAAQPMHVLGEFAARQLGIKRVATVADDFTYGHEGTASWYSAALDTAENRRFVQAVLAEYKVVPGFYTAGTYVSGMYLESALNAVKGRFEDKPAFVRALHDVRLERSPMGPIRIDEYGKPVLNIYVRRVERKDGRLVNSIVARSEEVTQFWSFDPPKFLAAPGYSRDYPPACNLE